MFEKIFQKLKEQRAANSSVSDRTLETLARTLETLITTDEILATYNAKTAVDELEGNIRHIASEAVKMAQEKKEKEAKDKAEKEAKKKAADEAAKKANGGKEQPEYVTALMEQNRLLAESLQNINAKVEGMEKNTITNSRAAKLAKKLEGVPEYLATPIKNSFKVATFENDDSFNNFLTEIEGSTTAFKEAAKKQGLNTFAPSTEVKPPKETGQTPELEKARELVNKQKEKENATNHK